MRIKVLLCAAALAAGAVSSMAQNVYSLNVVGYVNIPLVEGFNLIANPLDADGTGTNNNTTGVFSTNLPVNTKIWTWDATGVTFNFSTYATVKGVTKWTPDIALNPGQGAWLQIPAGAFGGGTQMVTTVGQVLQGNLSNPNLPTSSSGGFALLSSQIPLAGGLTTTLGYVPTVGDKVWQWMPTGGGSFNFNSYSTVKGVTKWSPAEPSLAIGEGFWLDTTNSAPSWKTNFTVQ